MTCCKDKMESVQMHSCCSPKDTVRNAAELKKLGANSTRIGLQVCPLSTMRAAAAAAEQSACTD